jgi:hypothetical protein
MEYAQIQKALSAEEFAEFLRIVGTDEPKFNAWKDKFCDRSTIADIHCADSEGSYCDPQYCHSG